MKSSNVFIKNHFEIHVEEKSIVVKDIPNRHYLRFSGSSMEIIAKNMNSQDFDVTLEKLFSSRSYTNNKRLIRFTFTDNSIFKECIGKLPDSLFRLSTVTAVIILGLLLGTIATVNINCKQGDACWGYVLWAIANIVVHELGHVVLCIRSGRAVHSFGIKLNYGLPMAYVDTSDICMSSLDCKIATSLGGVYFNSFLCIATAILYLTNKVSLICYFSRISLFFIISNLIPFFRFDGYFILSDWLDVGNLNKASNKAFRNRIRHKQDLCKRDGILVLYFFAKNLFFLAVIISVIIRVL